MSKFGCFLFFLGAVFLGLFILSDVAKDTNFTYLLAGGLLFFLSLLFRKPKIENPPESNRFRIIKKFRNHKK
jgi:hypothetical protein